MNDPSALEFACGAGRAHRVLVKENPVLARSAVTVAAISEATVQVLLSRGTEQLTAVRRTSCCLAGRT
jgi:hypothetical protein